MVLTIPTSHHQPSTRPAAGAAPPTPVGEILTVEQAADRMNMSVRYVRRLVADRRIAFHRIGRSIRLMATDVDAHVAAGRVEPLTESEVWREMRSVG
ncbi:excisionase family DNA-binding protein [Parafrankia soli]|uniref:excisionase family DNA-binding protein n=1 Tax=Parafrankia soli TaxID=2599596 RepID=UPI0034D429CB